MDAAGALIRRIDPLLPTMPARPRTAVDVDALYRAHRDRLIGLATAIVMDHQLAEEVVHDAFVGLQRHAGRVDQPVGYLQRTVVNRGIAVLRRRRVAANHVAVAVPPVSAPEIDETWAAVVRLPPKQRAVVVLRFWQDMKVDEIAATLGWPNGSVKSALHRALRRLKEELR